MKEPLIRELNALVLSPDAAELGIVVHANCMKWYDEFQIARMPVARFASLVYDDTGFRALQACAYARKNDSLAETALTLAITRGGDAVRARAAKDRDFDGVRGAPWFVELTGTAPVDGGYDPSSPGAAIWRDWGGPPR